ncbi:hypothetical protein [Bartonella sp. DGB1]|uniref:hypothetical protein n=1 Tax=Bartonella sp. DGB1 TaxID=3239807 RepID=UPI0035243496
MILNGEGFNARSKNIVKVTKGTEATDAATITNLNEAIKELNTTIDNKFSNSMILNGEGFNAQSKKISNVSDATFETDIVNVRTAKSLISTRVETRLSKVNEKSHKKALVIGSNALVNHATGIAIGASAKARGNNAVAVGNNASATNGGIAIGNNSSADDSNEVSFGKSNLQRKLVNIAKGMNNTDVINIEQLNNSAIYLNNDAYSAIDQIISNVAPAKNRDDVINVKQLNEFAPYYNDKAYNAINKNITNVKDGLSKDDAINVGQVNSKERELFYSIKKDVKDEIGNDRVEELTKKLFTDNLIHPLADQLITEILNKKASYILNSIIDEETSNYKEYSVNKTLLLVNKSGKSGESLKFYDAKNSIISNLEDAKTDTDAVNVKTAKSLINKNVETRLGKINEKSIEGALVIGNNALADHINAIAIGNAASAKDENSLAFGNDANAQAGGIAIGNNSFANGNVVSFGQKGLERRLTNVDKGINDTDVINIEQLNNYALYHDGKNYDGKNKKISNVAKGEKDNDAATLANLNHDKEKLEQDIAVISSDFLVLTDNAFSSEYKRISNLADAKHETDAVNLKTAESLINENLKSRLGEVNEHPVAIAIGNNTNTNHSTSIAIGNAASAKDENSLAFGNDANAQAGGIAIGNNSFANGNVVRALVRKGWNVD